jgi:hypothetical protein
MFGGVVSPAPRVVGPSSARITGVDVPAGVRILSPFLQAPLTHSFCYRQSYQSLPHLFTKIPIYSLTRRRSIRIAGSSLTLASWKIIWCHSPEAPGVVLE